MTKKTDREPKGERVPETRKERRHMVSGFINPDYVEQVEQQRDELLAALRRIEMRTHGSDGSNQAPAKALLSIQRMAYDAIARAEKGAGQWSGSPDPTDPDNYWIDDETGERVNALTGERSKS
jgi:hypothetical protein